MVLSLLGGLTAVCCALAIFFEGVGNLDQNSGERSRPPAGGDPPPGGGGLLRRPGGLSPRDLSYIEEHWGVQIDRSRYAVFYQVEGSNLMPDITVLERET